MKDRIRILVTHQIQILDKVDIILAIEDGQIKHKGTIADLKAEGIDFEILERRDNEASSNHEARTDKLRFAHTPNKEIKSNSCIQI